MLFHLQEQVALTLILHPPPMLMPPPMECPVLDAIAAVPVAVCVIPGIPDITLDVTEAMVSCPEWAMMIA